jgi:hypothetical protein
MLPSNYGDNARRQLLGTLDPTMSSNRDDMLFELEQRLAQVGRKLSAEDAASLIAEDFVEFGASGKVWSKAEIIAAMSQWSPIERIVENFSVRELSASVCLVTYKVVGVTKDRQASPFSLRSSLWRDTGGRWQIIFHQGTNVQ